MTRPKVQPITTRNKVHKKCGRDEWLWQGDRWRCAPCERDDRRVRRSPQKERSRMLKYRYGITAAAFDTMLVQQQGRCDICEDPMARPHVDHCHATGEARSLLCTHCNRLLGGARDNAQLLVAALDYLTRHHPSRFTD